jgi:general stress protein 26
MRVRTDEEAVHKVHDLIGRAKTCMFGTYDAQGLHHSRPMVASDHDARELWFFARDDSRKIREIAADPRVTLHYVDDGGNNYVSVAGRAVRVDDEGKIGELFSEPLRTWFPKGVEDPHITLIRVDMETAEYWDSPSSVVVHAAGYAKALTTGKTPSPGDVGQVRM